MGRDAPVGVHVSHFTTRLRRAVPGRGAGLRVGVPFLLNTLLSGRGRSEALTHIESTEPFQSILALRYLQYSMRGPWCLQSEANAFNSSRFPDH